LVKPVTQKIPVIIMEKKPTYAELEATIENLKEKLHRYECHESVDERFPSESHIFALLTALMNQTNDYILIGDEHGVPKLFNHAYALLMKEAMGIDMKPGVRLQELLDDPEAVTYWDELCSRALQGERFRAEYSHVFGKNDIRTFDVRFSPILKHGEITGFIEVSRDITDHKQIEKTLRKSEWRFRNLIEGSLQGVLIHKDHKPVFVNTEWAAIHGYSPEEVLQMDSVVPLISPNDRERMIGYKDARLQGKSAPLSYEYEGVRKDGSLIWLENRVMVVRWDGEPAIQTIIVDISERKHAEKALQESEKRYRAVVEDMPVLICTFRPGGIIRFVNRNYCEYFEKTPDELIGSNFLQLIPESERQVVMNNISSLTLESPVQSHEHRMFAPEGEIRWQKWTNRAFFDNRGNLVEYQSIGEDVTERREAQEALRESEELHRITLSNISDTVFITDDSGYFTYICPNVNLIFGYTYEEVASFKHIEKLLGADLFQRADLETSGELANIERTIQDKSGAAHILLVNVKLVSIKGGTVLYTCRDITERKQAEDALKAGEERYRRMFEDIILGIFQSTPDGRILHVNPAFSRMFGYASPKDLIASIGDAAAKLYAQPEDRMKLIKGVLASDVPVAAEVNFCRQDGSTFVGNFHGWKVVDATQDTLYVEGFIEDITDRKMAEESLKDSHNRLQYLSARLLSAQENEQRRISLEIHDVMGQDLALLKMQLIAVANRLRKDQQTLRKDLDRTLVGIDGIIEKARNLSRDLNPAIIEDLKLSGALNWLIQDIKEHVTTRISLDMDPVDHLFSIENQIVIYRIVQEALKNIVKHAEAGSAAVTIRKTDRYVLLAIEDVGNGFEINEVWNRHVADRGLGLAAMDERTRMLGGAFGIQSEPGKGTYLSLRIPLGRERGAG